MRRTLPPSAEIEDQIDQLLAVGVGENPQSPVAKLGARLIIQRAVEDEFDAWLGRARYERRPGYQRGLRNFDSGLRNGYRPRAAADRGGRASGRDPAGSRGRRAVRLALFPHSTKLLRTRPLEAMVVGAFVRGLSMRDVESLCEEAGLGKALEVDRVEDLLRASRALRGVQAPRPLRGQARRPLPRRDLPQRQTAGPEGGRPLRLGLHRGRRTRPGGGLPRDARVARGLAQPGTRPDRPRAAGADARCRRRQLRG